MTGQRIHFVTGRLAAASLRELLVDLAGQAGFAHTLEVLPITVAALMTPAWVARHLHVPADATLLLLPGWCEGALQPIRAVTDVPVERGPRDLRELPEYFGGGRHRPAADGSFDVEILAEINHAPRLAREQLVRVAEQLVADGADIVDLGCELAEPWSGAADAVRALCDRGIRVSIDTFDPGNMRRAVEGGAELILSANSRNRRAVADLGCAAVAVPDDPATLEGLEETADFLAEQGAPVRLDPVLEPIGCGFAASLGRYLELRRRRPDCQLLMGIGNLTELTDCDSAPLNVLLLGFCQELGIRSVLTTQVINWARTSVRECDLARRLVRHSVQQGTPPKHVEPRLVMLRDPKLREYGLQQLSQLAEQIKDNSVRIFCDSGVLHLISAQLHLQGDDPFLLFQQLCAAVRERQAARRTPVRLDASHAFYLGYEMAKAVTALTLGKQYHQDEALQWGLLTRPEDHHRSGWIQTRQAAPDDADGGVG